MEERLETPQLFTGNNEDYDNSQESHNNGIDTDLSDLNFEDKDDLEIPAFLRRQTN